MPCFGPLTAYYSKDVNPATGLRSLVFDKRKSHSGVALQVPCGKCIGCKLERKRQWMMRCIHEKRMHAQSAFLTLTYSEKNMPVSQETCLPTLYKRDLQLFMKRLRKVRPQGIRFFACGEYGEKWGRPHYHVLLLNTSFPDMKSSHQSLAGNALHVSAELDGLWNMGHSLVGEVTAESCAYVCGYVIKKQVAEDTVFSGRAPEFTVMSRRPGLGATYYKKFGAEAHRHDNVIIDGVPVGLPRYYDEKFKSIDSKELERLKRVRRLKALLHKAENTSARRRAREAFELKKLKFFKRGDL